jgi:hypothetical protein
MARLDYIDIPLTSLKLIELQQQGAFRKKVIRILAKNDAYAFLVKNADSFFEQLKNHSNAEIKK